MRVAFEPIRQGRSVGRDKRHSLSGETAERTLIAAMAGRRVLGRSFVVVDLYAELGGVAKERLKLGGDGRVIGASKGGRGHRGRRRGGEKLNDERERDNEGGQRRASRRSIAASPRSTRRFSVAAQVSSVARAVLPCVAVLGLAQGGHQHKLTTSVGERPRPS
jgi:hypothetical protein